MVPQFIGLVEGTIETGSPDIHGKIGKSSQFLISGEDFPKKKQSNDHRRLGKSCFLSPMNI
jgi:hypothetical protein